MTLSNICPVHDTEHEGQVPCKDCGTPVPIRHDELDLLEDLCEGCRGKRLVAFWKRIGVRRD